MPNGSQTQDYVVFTQDGRRRHTTLKRHPALVQREQAECAVIDAHLAEIEVTLES